MDMNDINKDFGFVSDSPKIIKVIGVGGGGGNAVKHMCRQGIHDVTFVLCNTDIQALNRSEVPIKIQLGPKVCQGLGAGNDPEVARQAAEESIEDIRQLFNDGTQMAFVTAGMGGGTGTGAAPIVARVAKEMGLLTVGVVTIPFLFEKRKKIMQALKGVEEMSKNVDALLVINNERLREIFTDGMTTLTEAYAKADDILSVATKSIAEIITIEGTINLDFRDVKKILKDGGVAIMSTGSASGENRVKRAIENALHSPLLNNNDITHAQKILFNISASEECPLLIDEMNEIDSFMNSLDPNIEVIWGESTDNELGQDAKIIILATGFGTSSVPGMEEMKIQRSKEEQEQLEEEEVRDQELIDRIYNRDGKERRRPRRQCYLFEADELDDTELITLVENSPTYRRDKATLAQLHEKAMQNKNLHPAEEMQGGNGGIISFED